MQGILPTYYYKVNEKKNVLIEERLRTLRNWLNLPEDQRPHILALYFPDTDHQGHTFGPDAPESHSWTGKIHRKHITHKNA